MEETAVAAAVRTVIGKPEPPNLFTVAAFAERHKTWATQPALRSLILNSAERVNSRGEVLPGNGLSEARAIVRVGRRVLIDEAAFFCWIAAQQRNGRRPA